MKTKSLILAALCVLFLFSTSEVFATPQIPYTYNGHTYNQVWEDTWVSSYTGHHIHTIQWYNPDQYFSTQTSYFWGGMGGAICLGRAGSFLTFTQDLDNSLDLGSWGEIWSDNDNYGYGFTFCLNNDYYQSQPFDTTNFYTSQNVHLYNFDFSFNLAAPFLSMPLLDYTPYNAPVSAVFDHSATATYSSDTDHHVTAFNGEVSDDTQSPYLGTTCYPKEDNSAFGSGFNYDGISGAGVYYLCYDGHPGNDYPVSNGTPVYAAADGIAHIPSSFPGYANAQTYNTVEVDHQNGYKTYYLHLSIQNVTENQQVYKGVTIIGYSGDTGASGAYHLHFEVQKETLSGYVPVDPYGWTGSGSDPYTRAANIALWE